VHPNGHDESVSNPEVRLEIPSDRRLHRTETDLAINIRKATSIGKWLAEDDAEAGE
jgi:hypothetical protein